MIFTLILIISGDVIREYKHSITNLAAMVEAYGLRKSSWTDRVFGALWHRAIRVQGSRWRHVSSAGTRRGSGDEYRCGREAAASKRLCKAATHGIGRNQGKSDTIAFENHSKMNPHFKTKAHTSAPW